MILNRHNLVMKSDGQIPIDHALHKMWKYWRDLRTTRCGAIPRKSDIRISGLGNILPSIVLSERLGEDAVIIRLAGTLVEDMTGQRLSGLNLLDLSPAEQRTRISDVYANLFAFPCGFHISESVRISDGKKFTLSALVLPLAAKDGEPRYTIGQYALSRNGFEDAGINATSVIEHRQIDEFGYIDVGFGRPD